MSGEAAAAVVLDIGSDSCKAGLAGEDDPSAVIPSVLGQKGNQEVPVAVDTSKKSHVGQEAIDLANELILKYPVDRGAVVDWDGMEILLEHIFKDKLHLEPSNQPLLLTETHKNDPSNREKLAELLFEKFRVPALFIASPAMLSLFAAGRTTGLVLDIGAGVTTAVPIYEGFSLAESVVRQNIAGSDITDNLIKLLAAKGQNWTTPAQKIQAKLVKEKLALINNGAVSPSGPSASSSYQLPDGQTITLGPERFQCTELLFKPETAGFAGMLGLHEMINTAISSSELDTRKSLYTNIVLAGGSSLLDGLARRLKTELKAFGPLGGEARIITPKDRITSAWTGGSVLAGQPALKSKWITQAAFKEAGVQILHSGCP